MGFYPIFTGAELAYFPHFLTAVLTAVLRSDSISIFWLRAFRQIEKCTDLCLKPPKNTSSGMLLKV